MKSRPSFQAAFLWHLDTHGTKMTDLSRATGVSLDVLKKLKSRPNSSTSAESGAQIAAFYGKSVDEFINFSRAVVSQSETAEFLSLLDRLTAEERKLLLRQLRGMARGGD